MNGKKAKSLRKLAQQVGAKFPEVEYIKRDFQKTFLIDTALGPSKRTLTLQQWFLGKCQRKLYKQFKKVYLIGLRQGVAHD